MTKNILLLLLSVLISLLFAEAVLRLTEENLGYSWMYRVPDAVFGWKLKPDTSYLYRVKEGTFKVSHNSDGWRDVEHALEPDSPEILRIAVLGDSFMEGYSVGDDDYFARRLEGLLNTERTNAEVFNFGVGGYGPLQYYLSFMHAAKPYKPKLVLAGIYLGNDISNVSFEIENRRIDGLKVDSRPYLDPRYPDQIKIFTSDYDRAVRNYKFRSAFLSSALNRAAFRVYKEWIDPISANPGKGPEKAGAGLNFDACKAYEEAWVTFERILRELKVETEKTDATFVLFSVPTANLLTPRHETSCTTDQPEEKLARLTNELGIPYINLFPVFENESRKNGVSSVFHLSDRHWNVKGHALATGVILQELRDRDLVP